MAGLEFLSDQGFRLDGRRAHELRRVQCKLGVFDQADGSAYIEQGNTKVLATVYGPHEVKTVTFVVDNRVIQYRSRTEQSDTRRARPRGASSHHNSARPASRDAGCQSRDAGCQSRDAGCQSRDAGCQSRVAGCQSCVAGCQSGDAGCQSRGGYFR